MIMVMIFIMMIISIKWIPDFSLPVLFSWLVVGRLWGGGLKADGVGGAFGPAVQADAP